MKSLRIALSLSLLLLALPPAALAQDKPQDKPPSSPENPAEANAEAKKALVRRYLGEILSLGRLDLLDQLVAADFVDSTPGAPKEARGPEVIRSAQQRAREIFPVVEYRVEELIAEGDKVVARYTVRATSKGNGSAPGRPIEVTGVTIFRIGEGKIREAWIVNDQIDMFLQLGYILQPPQ